MQRLSSRVPTIFDFCHTLPLYPFAYRTKTTAVLSRLPYPRTTVTFLVAVGSLAVYNILSEALVSETVTLHPVRKTSVAQDFGVLQDRNEIYRAIMCKEYVHTHACNRRKPRPTLEEPNYVVPCYTSLTPEVVEETFELVPCPKDPGNPRQCEVFQSRLPGDVWLVDYRKEVLWCKNCQTTSKADELAYAQRQNECVWDPNRPSADDKILNGVYERQRALDLEALLAANDYALKQNKKDRFDSWRARQLKRLQAQASHWNQSEASSEEELCDSCKNGSKAKAAAPPVVDSSDVHSSFSAEPDEAPTSSDRVGPN